MVDQAERDVANSVGIVRHHLTHRAVGVLHYRGGVNVLLAHHQLLKGASRAGALLAGDHGNAMVRPAQLFPVAHLAREDLPHLGKRQIGDRVAWMHDDGDGIEGDHQGPQLSRLVAFQLARRHANLGRAGKRRLDTSAGAAALYVNHRLGVGPHVLLGHQLGERFHRGGAGHGHAGRAA